MDQEGEGRLNRIIDSEFARALGIRVTSISEQEVRLEMDLDGKLNSIGTGHGGAVFSLADQAFALSANQGEHPQVARSASIKYLKPAKGTLTAVARKVSEDDRGSVHHVSVLADGVLVAEFEGIGHKLKGRPR
jgi:acyl-CoA thioesterase